MNTTHHHYLNLRLVSRGYVRQTPGGFLDDGELRGAEELLQILQDVVVNAHLRLLVVARQHVTHHAQRGVHHLHVGAGEEADHGGQDSHRQHKLRHDHHHVGRPLYSPCCCP